MENFNVDDANKSLFIQVKLSSIYKATTMVYLKIDEKIIKPAVAHSDPHENGNIDLDQNGNFQWSNIGLANTFKGNKLLFITSIFDIPTTLTGNVDVKEFILRQIEIDYLINQTITSTYTMNDNDSILRMGSRAATIYKTIQIS
jgi:hypothetical protein